MRQRALGFGREAYGITFISTFEREEWCVSANLGYLYNEYGLQSDRDAYRKDIWSASLSGQYEFFEKLWLVGEVGVLSNPNVTSDTPPAYILGGFIYELTKSIDLDIGYKYGLNKPMVDYSISRGHHDPVLGRFSGAFLFLNPEPWQISCTSAQREKSSAGRCVTPCVCVPRKRASSSP